MPTDPNMDREFGELKSTVRHLEGSISKAEHSIDRLTKAVDDLAAIVDKFKGGWFAVGALVTIAGAVGAAFSKFFAWLVTQ